MQDRTDLTQVQLESWEKWGRGQAGRREGEGAMAEEIIAKCFLNLIKNSNVQSQENKSKQDE